jgi:hypothetical protein
LEESVREVWTEVLGVPGIGATTSFFDAGGDTLAAMRMVSRLHARHGGMSMRAFMAAPTIAGLADVLVGAPPESDRPAGPPGEAASPGPTSADTAARYPLTRAQRQMWDIASRLPGVGLFIVASLLRADGPLDPAILERVFAVLAERHEALRTRFEDTADGPVQVVEPRVTIAVELVDHTGADDPVLSAEKAMALAGREALPLDHAPLLRVVVHRIAAERHVLFLGMHHIVCDGQSLTMLEAEAARSYQEIVARGAPVPRPVPIGSGRLAQERSAWLATDEAARQREFWLERLAPPYPALADGPGSRFAGPGDTTFKQRMRSAGVEAWLSAEDMRAVGAAAGAHGMTDFMLVLGAYAATLRQWSGLTDIRIATALANRAGPGMDEVVGFLANTIVLRLRVDDTDPVAVSRQAREVCIDAFENQELPFEEMLAELHHRHPGAGALFDAMLVAQNEIAPVSPHEGLLLEPYEPGHNVLGAAVVATACAFVLTIMPVGEELQCQLRYQPATTSAEQATELLAAILQAVRATAAALRAAA